LLSRLEKALPRSPGPDAGPHLDGAAWTTAFVCGLLSIAIEPAVGVATTKPNR
jgi:hypothetical protein